MGSQWTGGEKSERVWRVAVLPHTGSGVDKNREIRCQRKSAKRRAQQGSDMNSGLTGSRGGYLSWGTGRGKVGNWV